MRAIHADDLCRTLPYFHQPSPYTQSMLPMKYWCEKSPQITNSSHIWSTYRILQENWRKKSQDSQAKAINWRGIKGEKRKMCNKKNSEYPAMCVSKQIAWALSWEKNVVVTSNPLLARVQLPIHRIHLNTFIFDYAFCDYISHGDKFSTQRSLFKVWSNV